MESSDVFTSPGVEVTPGEDPFTGGEDWAGFGVQGDDAPAAVSAEPPVVDKEGEPVPAPIDPWTMSEEELARAEEGYQYRASHGEPISAEALAAHEHYVATRLAPQETAPAVASADSGLPLAPEAPSPADGPEAAQEPVRAPEPTPEAQAAPQPPQEPPPLAPPVAPEPEDAPVPEETQSASGKTTHRRYVVLQATDSGKFEQLAWYEDKNGKIVKAGTSGAKRQTVALARGTDDALKTGYLALGAPEGGVTLVAVAALHFQPRKVRPKPPEPSRTRLEIS